MTTQTKTLLALSLSCLAFAACEPEPPLLDVYPLPDEVPDMDVSYIPFEYADTGHNYHMSLLSMELAAHGVPNLLVTAEECDGEFDLVAPNGDTWGYHTAVAIQNDAGVRIIDPVVSGNLLTVEQFGGAFQNENVRVVPNENDAEEVFVCENAATFEVPLRVEDMSFNFDNVMIYCSYMRRFMREIGGDYAERETRLIQRVHELTVDLYEKGAIEAFAESDELKTVLAGPYCPPPIPAK